MSEKHIKVTPGPNGKTAALIAGATLLVAIVGIFVLVQADAKPAEEKPLTTKDKEHTTPMDTLQMQTIQEGSGEGAKNGDLVTVHYTGTLTNGTKFDSSLDRGQPFSFKLGLGQVIAGWEQGILGMKVGEKRKLTIPPALGYGAAPVGTIPANSTLVFDVELLKIN